MNAEPEGVLSSLSGRVESARLAALHGMRVLDTAPDPRFDRIVRLAAALFDAPRATVMLIDKRRIWIKAHVGLDQAEWPRRDGVVEAVLRGGAAVFFGDVRAHAELSNFADLRFFAAAPLMAEGQVIGLLTVADERPHPDPTPPEQAALIDLAALAMEELERNAEAVIAREHEAVEEERADLALTAAGLAAYEWEADVDRLHMSERFRAMIGLVGEPTAVEAGLRVMSFVHPDDLEAVRLLVSEAMTGSGRYHLEHRIIRPSDGRTIWVASSGLFVRGVGGQPRRLIGVVQDITERKVNEEQRETLVAELDHRVKNVLAAVQSLVAQSARKAASLEGFLKTFAGRLKSMASAHELLTATRWRGAGMLNIAAAELGGLAPGQTRWEGPDVLLTPRATGAMSLALHELATNAVKFGALSTEFGRVEVSWRRSAEGGLELLWTESGGPPVAQPARRGFGTTLFQKVTGRELGGEVRIDYRREGVRALLTVNPAAVAAWPQAGEAACAPAPASRAGASGGPPTPAKAIRVDGLRLLIVEDAVLLTLELEAGLTEAGAVIVGAATDLEEAIRMVGLDMDAAVLDANLNGASVRPVALALAKRGVPFVFATGYGDDKVMFSEFDAPVIRKPYDVTQVAAALAEITGRG